MDKFMNKFNFRKDRGFLIGVERECFITDFWGNIVPRSPEVLSVLTDRLRFGYELSACQLEDRIGPCDLGEMMSAFAKNEREIEKAENELCFRRVYKEVVPEDMPLDIYPDPTGRYQKIVANLSKNVLLAACQVAGTHIHIGMPDHHTALKVYNQAIYNLDRLCVYGDGSSGRRLKIYKTMAPEQNLRPFEGWNDFFCQAVEKNFAKDPRKCWDLIRISVHGTLSLECLARQTIWKRLLSGRESVVLYVKIVRGYKFKLRERTLFRFLSQFVNKLSN